MKLTLERYQSDDKATLGRIWNGDVTICMTLELPWRNNQHDISCIPEGLYRCVPLKDHITDSGYHFQRCIRLLFVPKRGGILIHPGNFLSDTNGCILPGEVWDPANSMLRGSREALLDILDAIIFTQFDLEITHANNP